MHSISTDGSRTGADRMSRVTTKFAAFFRRAVAAGLGALALLAGSLVIPATAGADQPEFWPDTEHVGVWELLLVLFGFPLLAAVVIFFFVYGASLARGERISGGAATTESEWLGGPRRTEGELAAPDNDESQAGGASGRW